MKAEECMNCGAWKGLHHYETLQCPRGGVETTIPPQLWETTTYRGEMTAKELKLTEENERLKEWAKESYSKLHSLRCSYRKGQAGYSETTKILKKYKELSK